MHHHDNDAGSYRSYKDGYQQGRAASAMATTEMRQNAHMHKLNRRSPRTGGTQPKGFTLLELAVALTAFALIAGVVTLTMARIQLVNAGARLEKAARAELGALLATAATSPYELLTTNTFTRPQECAANPSKSCVSVLGRQLEVTWDVTAAADLLASSTENPAVVNLKASVTLPGSLGEVAVTRTVASPNGGRDGTTGIVRVRSSGANYSGPVYLVDSNGAVVSSGRLENGRASLRGGENDCPRDTPCRIALGPEGQTATSQVTLDASSSTGEQGAIVLTADAVVEAGIVLLPRTRITVALMAITSDGTRGQPSQEGSVCLYLVFNDGVSQRAVPGCNDDDPQAITWETYTDSSGNELALPQGTPLTLTTDNPEGTCATAGQKGYQDGVWVSAAVCTSWTWGPLTGVSSGAEVNAPLLSTSLQPLLAPKSGAAYYRAIWDGPAAQPATGLPGQGAWESPRDIPACSATGSCTPVTEALEAVACLGEQCNSTAPIAPQITSPLGSGSWTYPNVVVAPNTRTAFSLTVVDADQNLLDPTDRISVTVTSAPAGLERQTAALPSPEYSAVTSGQSVGAGLVSGDTVNLAYFGAAAIAPNTTVTVTLSDGDGNLSVHTISLWQDPAAYHATAYPLVVNQGQTGTLLMTVLDQNGNPYDTPPLSVTGPAGTQAGTPDYGTDGQVSVPISVTSTPKGEHELTVMLPNDRAFTVPMQVGAELGSLTIGLSKSQTTQASTLQATASALDRAGDALRGVDINFALRDGENAALGAYGNPDACRTGSTGNCTVEILIEPKAPQTTLDVYAISGTTESAAVTLNITGTAAKITGPAVEVPQNSTLANPVDTTVTVVNGDGTPRSGVAIDIGSRPAGIRAEALGVSDANGVATIRLSALPGASAGVPQLLEMSADGASGGILVSITPSAGQLLLPSALSISQGGTTTTTVTAIDAQGEPMRGVTIAISTPESASGPAVIQGPGSVQTNDDGEALVRLSSPAGAQRGTYLISATIGSLVAWSSVFIGQGVAEVIAIGNLVRGETTPLTIVLRDSAGTNVPRRGVVIRPRDPLVTPQSIATESDSDGKVAIELTASNNLIPGFTVLDIEVDGRTMSAGVIVQ